MKAPPFTPLSPSPPSKRRDRGDALELSRKNWMAFRFAGRFPASGLFLGSFGSGGRFLVRLILAMIKS